MIDESTESASEEAEARREASLLDEILEASEDSVLKQLVLARGQCSVEELKGLLVRMCKQYVDGQIQWTESLLKTINTAVAQIDKSISQQMRKVMKAPELHDVEGRWRGLQTLVKNSELGSDLKIKVFNIDKNDCFKQFQESPTIDRSPLFNIIYHHEYGTAGGEPYGVLLTDYTFGFKGQDVALMRALAEVGAASHMPIIAAASPDMFGIPDFPAFAEGRPVAPGFNSPTYNKWNNFRATEDSRYLVLTLPRVMAREPYGKDAKPVEAFDFEEFEVDASGTPVFDPNTDFVWSNACFSLGLKISESFSRFGWCTAIRGMENGGKVEDLPNYVYKAPTGDLIQQCPTEVNITDEREKELSDLGFLPLIHYKTTCHATFIGAQTTQKPKVYDNPDATANAAISARLPYMMAAGRIAHYLKVIGRDRIGSNIEGAELQQELSTWLGKYTNAAAVSNDARAKFPLKESSVKVVEQRGRPGCYSAVAYLRPWLQLEELTASLRLVASIPS